MTETLRVLLVLEAVGLAALPLAVVALGRFAGGWAAAFAKPVGFVALGWLVWAGGRAGVPNDTPLVVGACAGLALAGLATWPLARRRGLEPRRWLAMEGLAVVAFLACALFNAFEPAVWGTEKPMDMAILATTIESPAYPPADPWLAGADLNYYYLGHLAAGVLVRLSGVELTAGYNLALAAVFAMLVVSVFAVGAAAGGRRPRLGGTAAVVMVALAGTVEGGLAVLRHDGPLAGFDWFGGARVIPGTINEFPAFSFLLGDLHAHVVSLPVTVVALAAVLQVAVHGPPRGLVRRPVETVVTALTIGALYAMNSWALPVAAGLFAAALAVWARQTGGWGRAAVHGGAVGALALLLVLPFVLEFEPNARGTGLVGERAELSDFLRDHAGIYGALLWALAAPFALRLQQARHPERVIVWGTAGALVAIFLLAEADLAGAGILAGLIAVAVGALLTRGIGRPERAMWLLAAGGLTCLLAPELVYVRDEFQGGELFRMNTVFKMGYLAWLLLALAAAAAVAVVPARLPRKAAVGWLGGLGVLVVLGLVYTVGASYARKDAFRDLPSLDGMAWLATSAPGDPPAIRWIRENVPRGAVVLEAVGDDYSGFGHARISTYTGRPTVLGWPGHELQFGHDAGNRAQEVERIYTSTDEAEVRRLLDRYDVRYAVVGPLERTDYGDAATLTSVGRLVFEREGTAVYEIPAGEQQPPPADDASPPALGGGG